MTQLAGARVLLTGASGGLGGAIARELHRRGARLALSGRRADALATLAAELDGEALPADLAQTGAAERLAAAAGPVDVLVANAALPASGRLESFSAEQRERALTVNLGAPIALAHALLPGMLERRRGQLVFVCSLAGKAAAPRASLYAATKAGLRIFALNLRAELRGSGVGVSSIVPGFISEAGMFARSGAKLPPGVGTRTPGDVAHAVARAIELDIAEVDVAPPALRLGAAFSLLAPDLASRGARLLGSERIGRKLTDAQRHER
jgi:short-subunit dehydrogenase